MQDTEGALTTPGRQFSASRLGPSYMLWSDPVELPELLSGVEGLLMPTWTNLAVSCCNHNFTVTISHTIHLDNSMHKHWKSFHWWQLLVVLHCHVLRWATGLHTYIYIYNLDAIPPVHVVWNHVDAGKLTTAYGGTFTTSSASLSNQSR